MDYLDQPLATTKKIDFAESSFGRMIAIDAPYAGNNLSDHIRLVFNTGVIAFIPVDIYENVKFVRGYIQ